MVAMVAVISGLMASSAEAKPSVCKCDGENQWVSLSRDIWGGDVISIIQNAEGIVFLPLSSSADGTGTGSTTGGLGLTGQNSFCPIFAPLGRGKKCNYDPNNECGCPEGQRCFQCSDGDNAWDECRKDP